MDVKRKMMSQELVEKFAGEHQSTYYERWVAAEGLRIIPAHYVPNLHEVQLDPWPRRGGYGVFINHEASARSNDCYVCEIPPGGKLNAQRQLYEEMVYILDGRGSTAVWNNAGQRISFEWQAGSLFAIPLNTWHQHFNGSGAKPARFVAVTNAPMVMNLYQSKEFIFNAPFDFTDRFGSEPDYFNLKNLPKGYFLETNFVPDVRTLPLVSAKERGGGGSHIRFKLAKGTMTSHISEFSVGTYKKAHRHGPGAHVIILTGEGYSLMWPEGEPIKKYDWREGSMIVPPNMWFHQHFNIGAEKARYLALKYEGTEFYDESGVSKAYLSTRLGGDQVEYADEDSAVRRRYEEELRKRGLESRMKQIYEAEETALTKM